MPEGKSPPIGYLRNFASVYVWSDEPEVGGPSVTPHYVLVNQCWCSLRSKGDVAHGGADIVESNLPSRSGTHVIRTRFRDDLSLRHMFEIAGNRYRVVAVRNDDARRFTELEAELMGDVTVIAPAPPIPRGLEDQEVQGNA